MIGFLMLVGLMVNVGGCGDDSNPVKSDADSNADRLVGTWLDEDGDAITFRSDGTFVDYDEDEGTWSLVGDQLTFTYDDAEYADDGWTDTLISVTDNEFTVTDEDGERYVSTRQNSGSQDSYSETILGTWKDDGDPIWTFSSDGTVLEEFWEVSYRWKIEGSTLSITDADGNLLSEHPYDIQSISSTKLVFISKINKVDGSGTIEEEVTYTR